MSMTKILIFKNNPEVIDYLVEVVEAHFECQVQACQNTQLCLDLLENAGIHILITDLRIRSSIGQHMLDYVLDHHPSIQCIIYTANTTIKQSVEAVKKGAVNYIDRTTTPDEIINSVKDAIGRLHPPNMQRRREDFVKGVKFADLVGESPKMQAVFKTIEKVAASDSTVLITGESGTGKELIARAIHYHSRRHNQAMVTINCGAIPGELLESELFGHEKGAFTGAHRSRIGRFEMANNGTIFLDEIGDMSPDLQVKLLRVLQEQCFERVGSTKTIHVNIRVLAATNKDLNRSIEEGLFREDLYYRLNVIPIKVPPLKERKTDIRLLIDFFMKRMGGRRKTDRKRLKTFSDEAMQLLLNYDWPGNVRELENMIERLSVLVENPVIQKNDLPRRLRGQEESIQGAIPISLDDGLEFNSAVANYQRTLILKALDQTNWVKAKAAELLKMNRTTLVEKIKKMNLEASR
jgi:DNA-binding NtrC family response regulator